VNKKALMMMANRDKGRRVNVEYEDWGARAEAGGGSSRGRGSGYGRGEYGGSGGRSEYGRSEYEGGMNYGRAEYDGEGYGPDSRFRDRRGREHYDNGRFAPMSMMGGNYPRYPDSRGGYDNPEMDSRYYPTYPIYEEERRERRMNPIGFAPSMNGSDATMPRYDEMERMQGQRPMQGYAASERMPRFDREMAEEWMGSLKNEDGTRGPHWTMDQAKQVMAQKEIDGSPWEFWAALNATYSDLCKMFKKYGINTVDAYVDFAKAFWLDDKDAVADKLAAYFTYVTKH